MEGLNKNELLGRIFVGEIVDNNDPEQEGRAKVKVFGLFDGDIDQSLIPWAQPFGRKMFAGGDGGFADISVPKIGTYVRVQFAEGDLMAPEYTSIQTVNPAVKADIKDSYLNSHVLGYDVDEDFKIFYTPSKGLTLYLKKSQIVINPDSSITIEHAETKSIIELVGPVINIVAQKEVKVTAPKIILDQTNEIDLGENAIERLILGDTFMKFFNSHTHLSMGGTPTTPPTIPMQSIIHLSGKNSKPVVKTV